MKGISPKSKQVPWQLNQSEHFEKNPFNSNKTNEHKKHLNIMLPVPNAIHKVKKIKKNKKKKPHLSGEISSNNDSPNIKPEIKFEELHN